MIKRKILSIVLSVCLVCTILAVNGEAEAIEQKKAPQKTVKVVKFNTEMKAVWVSFLDFQNLGLTNVREKTFKKNAEIMVKDAKRNGINTIFFHVRAFDDAAYKSKVFRAMRYLKTNASYAKPATSSFSYDPLKLAVEAAHKHGVQLHAWLNPYRVGYDYFLSPKSEYSTNRIIKAVNEILAYKVDGIHFDDYFYHAKKGYYRLNSKKQYSVNPATAKKDYSPSSINKRRYVNKLIRRVNKTTQGKALFSVSPAGNVDNCMNSGVDLTTWLSNDGYVDMIMPQIYWTDNWGASGRIKMFSSRLGQFMRKNKKKIPMVIGLALYRSGEHGLGDKGWSMRGSNISGQIKSIRRHGLGGYCLFRFNNLYQGRCKKEVRNMRKISKYKKLITKISFKRR